MSVVVPVYNAAKFLRKTLDAILAQTYRPLEIIAVNDGSTDSSQEILNTYAARIHCIQQENHGVAMARNVGVKHSRGQCVAFCDADDLWVPQKIEWQMEIITTHPGVGVVGGFMEEIDELGRSLQSGHRSLRLCDKPMNFREALLMQGNAISMSTSIIRKEIFQDIGGFKPGHKDLKAEDYDLWIRASNVTKFYVSSQCVGQYRVLKNSRSHGSLRKEYAAQFQLLRLYRREYSPGQYKIRKAKIYAEWADSSFVEGETHAWKLQVKAIRLHPTHFSYQFGFGWKMVKDFVKRVLR